VLLHNALHVRSLPQQVEPLKLRRRFTFSLALSGVVCGAFAADGVSIAERRTLSPPAMVAATHKLAIEIYAFAGTRWRVDEIVAALPRAAELLGQCAVAIDRVDLVTLNAPPPLRYYDTPVSRELVRTLQARKPALFFVEDTRNEPAFDAEAVGLANSGRRPELANTVWIAYGARDVANAMAHELVHVLSDSGEHSDAPGNLMRDETSPDNIRLTTQQCTRVRSRGQANGLLARTR
jgi:hypothetical protein